MIWEKLKLNRKTAMYFHLLAQKPEGNQICSLLNLWNFIADALVATMTYPTRRFELSCDSCLCRPVPLIQLNIRWKLESDVQLGFLVTLEVSDSFSWNLDELWCHCPKNILCPCCSTPIPAANLP
jgi:hypothetical protein